MWVSSQMLCLANYGARESMGGALLVLFWAEIPKQMVCPSCGSAIMQQAAPSSAWQECALCNRAHPLAMCRWKATIANKEFWSEALPVVTQYWHAHGFGITSRNSALRCAEQGACQGHQDFRLVLEL